MAVDKLPPAPVSISLTRVTYDAGAGRPAQSRPGPVLEYIESGSLEFESTGVLTVLRGPPSAQGSPSHQESTDPATLVIVNSGDSVFIAGNTEATTRNPGADLANVLVTEIGPADEKASALPNPIGVKGIAVRRLVFAVATTVPTDQAVIEVGRLTLAPGAKISSESAPGVAGSRAGPELVAVESGTFGLNVSAGEIDIFREGNIMLGTEGTGRREIAEPQAEMSLQPGDAILGQAESTDVAWNPGRVPATAILVRLLPAEVQR
jgi:hypothetical protein